MEWVRSLFAAHPVLLVGLAGCAVAGLGRVLDRQLVGKYRFKEDSNRQQAALSLYLGLGWAYFAWAVIFLAQAKPMILPE